MTKNYDIYANGTVLLKLKGRTNMQEKSIAGLKDVFDTYSKIALALGVILTILGAAGGISYEGYLPITNNLARISLMLAGGLLVVVSFSKNEAKRELTAADIAKLRVKILSPRPNDKIKGTVRVVVEASQKIPEGYELHVLRGYPRENGFIPNAKAQKATNRLEWTVEEFDIAGVKDDVRRIEVWLVGVNGRALLENWHVNHKILADANRKLKNLEQKVTWFPSIKTKTTDMHLCESISVTKDS